MSLSSSLSLSLSSLALRFSVFVEDFPAAAGRALILVLIETEKAGGGRDIVGGSLRDVEVAQEEEDEETDADEEHDVEREEFVGSIEREKGQDGDVEEYEEGGEEGDVMFENDDWGLLAL